LPLHVEIDHRKDEGDVLELHISGGSVKDCAFLTSSSFISRSLVCVCVCVSNRLPVGGVF
jgi:hypothetical protein